MNIIQKSIMLLLFASSTQILPAEQVSKLKKLVTDYKGTITVGVCAALAIYYRDVICKELMQSNLYQAYSNFKIQQKRDVRQSKYNALIALEKDTPKAELREILFKNRYESQEERTNAVEAFIERNPTFDLDTFFIDAQPGTFLPHQTALHKAVTDHNSSMIKLLVASKANINVQSDLSQFKLKQLPHTPLMLAHMNGRWGGTQELLLQQKADPNVGYDIPNNPRYRYMKENGLTTALSPTRTDTDAIKLLLAAGAVLPAERPGFEKDSYNDNEEVNALLTDDGQRNFLFSTERLQLSKRLGIDDHLQSKRRIDNYPNRGDHKSGKK